MHVLIAGKKEMTKNYRNALDLLGITYDISLKANADTLNKYDALLLPGGADIEPSLFGQNNLGSREIDVGCDVSQLALLHHFVLAQKPVLGICKGLQLINVYFGGSIIQDLPGKDMHESSSKDVFHDTYLRPGCFLESLYSGTLRVNSAHHQGIGALGHGLRILQLSPDQTVEALCHPTLPILGVQWHPERCEEGKKLLHYFFIELNPAAPQFSA